MNVATVTVTVNPVNDAPVANNSALNTIEDISLSGTLSASDVDGDPISYSLVTNGTEGTATITDTATGAYIYTLDPNAANEDIFTFKVNDSTVDSNEATVIFNIEPNYKNIYEDAEDGSTERTMAHLYA